MYTDLHLLQNFYITVNKSLSVQIFARDVLNEIIIALTI